RWLTTASLHDSKFRPDCAALSCGEAGQYRHPVRARCRETRPAARWLKWTFCSTRIPDTARKPKSRLARQTTSRLKSALDFMPPAYRRSRSVADLPGGTGQEQKGRGAAYRTELARSVSP